MKTSPAPAELAAAREQVGAAQRLLLITHISPDGDALGSLFGLGWALRAAGKEVVCACADPAPDTFAFLPGFDGLTNAPEGAFDLVITLDVSDESRLGRLAQAIGRAPDLQFDHHVTNPGYARLNLVDVEAASTAELVARLLAPLGLPLGREAAECLLTGILTDTLGFRTSNTSPQTLATVQQLMAAGAPLHTLYDRALFKRSFSAVRLWSAGPASIRLEDRIVWAKLPLQARRAAGYGGTGDADLIDVLTSVREADVALIFVERPDGKIKISWRSAPGINVAELASRFGGGGHAPAAGAEITGTLAEVEALVLAATRAALQPAQPAEAAPAV